MKESLLHKILLNKNVPHIYFIGIGGKGNNGIAKYCMKREWKVSGSDLSFSPEILELRKYGAKIFQTHHYSNIDRDIDLVVCSSIISKDNPEILAACKLGIPILKRSEFLGEIMRQYNTRISVCGSHGKSTTTALCGMALSYSDLDPTVFGGAFSNEFSGYERFGRGNYVVSEACEYAESFYDLIADISVITSIERSHMEYYKTEGRMFDAFKKFISMHSRDAVIIANGDDSNIQMCLPFSKATVETFGFNSYNSYVIKNVRYLQNGSLFDLFYKDVAIARNIRTMIPGNYNIYNFAAISVLMHVLNLSLSPIYEIGRNFTGVSRRFEISPVNSNLIFVDDFCHHPTQVKYLFEGIKQFFPNKKVCAVFQPRQFHLMKTFIKEYGESFKVADSVIVTDILPALGDTEEDKKKISSPDIIDSIKKYSNKDKVFYISKFEEIVRQIKDSFKGSWVVATIGAGDIYKVRDMYSNV